MLPAFFLIKRAAEYVASPVVSLTSLFLFQLVIG